MEYTIKTGRRTWALAATGETRLINEIQLVSESGLTYWLNRRAGYMTAGKRPRGRQTYSWVVTSVVAAGATTKVAA